MKYLSGIVLALFCARIRAAEQKYHSATAQTWTSKYGPESDLPFTGPLSFAHLPLASCLFESHQPFDVAILGMPFDTAVSYRPGARFGPHGIRAGSRRLRKGNGYSREWGFNPYSGEKVVIDCGDVPISPFDNALAIDQMEFAYSLLLDAPVANSSSALTARFSNDGKERPRIITLGGDHTIVLPILRSLHKVYGKITVIHFDSHLDTWPGTRYGFASDQAETTHGTFFWVAHREGLMSSQNVHAGIRCKFGAAEDIEHDEQVGFMLIPTDEIDTIGTDGIIRRIRERVGDSPVYLSLDIDVLDPAFAPATGTPEPGGWSSRELNRILRGLDGLNFVGADVVEVAPAYDTNAETTAIAAANIVHELLSLFHHQESALSFPQDVKEPPLSHEEL